MKVSVILYEDRGADTHVWIFIDEKKARNLFDSIVEDIRKDMEVLECLDEDSFNLTEDHLSYDMNDSWGNVKIITKEFKGELK